MRFKSVIKYFIFFCFSFCIANKFYYAKTIEQIISENSGLNFTCTYQISQEFNPFEGDLDSLTSYNRFTNSYGFNEIAFVLNSGKLTVEFFKGIKNESGTMVSKEKLINLTLRPDWNSKYFYAAQDDLIFNITRENYEELFLAGSNYFILLSFNAGNWLGIGGDTEYTFFEKFIELYKEGSACPNNIVLEGGNNDLSFQHEVMYRIENQTYRILASVKNNDDQSSGETIEPIDPMKECWHPQATMCSKYTLNDEENGQHFVLDFGWYDAGNGMLGKYYYVAEKNDLMNRHGISTTEDILEKQEFLELRHNHTFFYIDSNNLRKIFYQENAIVENDKIRWYMHWKDKEGYFHYRIKSSRSDNEGLSVGEEKCGSILGMPDEAKTPAWYLQIVFEIMKYIGIVILIVFTIMDFVGAVLAHDDNKIKESMRKGILRLVCCVVIFILPTLIKFILTFLDIYGPSTCGIE